MSDERTIHDLDVARRTVGDILSWRDGTSPTGFLSGIITAKAPGTFRVTVRDIRPAIIERGPACSGRGPKGGAE